MSEQSECDFYRRWCYVWLTTTLLVAAALVIAVLR